GRLEPLLERNCETNPPLFQQRCNFPQADIAEEGTLIGRKAIQRGNGRSPQTVVLGGPPDPGVSIQDRGRRHLSASISLSSIAGSSGSSNHCTLPRNLTQGF